MNLVLIEPDSIEWNYMWEWLSSHPINKGIENPSIALHEGEAWQYMGSLKEKERTIHQFRHRNHPVTNGVESLSVSASDGFSDNQITNQYKL